jgi:hypothetical protein
MHKYPNQTYPDHRLHVARPAIRGLVVLTTCVALISAPQSGAQAPAAASSAAPAQSPAEIEKLVAPIALYPDELVAIILPASTDPLQIVQAARFLDQRKQNPNLQVEAQWADSVKALLNYPDVVQKMNTDLNWTVSLGEAVATNQAAVMDAVQTFRRQAQSAGNLKSDSKQTVVVEQEIIKIEPANPQVIYVPQYNPTTVVAYSPYPAFGYYPVGYPNYYYPYAPGAALATGLIWGAALGAVWSGARYGTNWGGGSVTVNRNTNINASNYRSASAAQGTAWRSDKTAAQVRSGAGNLSTASRANNFARPGDPAGGARGAGAAQQRAGGMQDSRQAGAAGDRSGSMQGARQDSMGGSRAGATQQFGGDASRSQAGGGEFRGGGESRGGGAFSGYGSGGGARADSFRGAESRGFGGGGFRGGGFRGGRR